ncbi:MAG: hypothetical protein K0A89_05570 [ANME-2 cluster archaeon]|nr:hypothetical protein [ANME-2 cluster archaeon]
MNEISTYDGMHVRNPRNNAVEYNVPEGFMRILVYLLSFVLPFGMVTGIYYSIRPDYQSKVFGKNCFMLSITPLLATIIVLVIALLSMAVIFALKY